LTGVDIFPYRLGLQQRVLPRYRADFFDALAAACAGGLSVFAGQPRPREAIETAGSLQVARLAPARNLHILGGPAYLCAQPGLLRWLAGWDPQALVVEANPRYLSTPAAVRWMHRRRRWVVGWGLGAPAVGGPLAGLRQAARQGFLRQFDALVTYSQQGAEEYRAASFPPGRVFVAPNAATRRPTFPLPERPASFRPRPTVLFVGRLQERKRVDLLLQACARLPVALQPRLCIVGDGPARPGLETLARSVYPAAEFTGAKHGPDLEPFYTTADLFVLPGTGGLAVQQAMSYGLPVIVAEADGTRQDLVRPTNGWELPPGDLEALVAVLGTALADVGRLRQMGAVSYRIVCEEINIEAMVKAFLEALRVKL
jgi:glycosyltransferase involved in cell wall biosynthesis